MSMAPATIAPDATMPHLVRRDATAIVERAFDRCADSLHRFFAVRLGGDVHVTDDLMQQLWTQAIRHAPAASDENVEHWLRGVSRNLIRTHWRRMAARPDAAPVADPALAAELSERIASGELPAAELERREVRDQLLLAITDLPFDEQELIVGHYFENLAHADIAERLGTSIRAVEGRLYRARQSLRHRLAHME